MEAIADDYFYYIPEANAVVELQGESRQDVLYGTQTYGRAGVAGVHVPWGDDNLAPQKMLRLSAENPIKMGLIKTSRNLLLGDKLILQKRVLTADKGQKVYVFEPFDDLQIEDFLEEIETKKYLRKAGFNYEFGGNIFANLSIDRFRKVSGLTCFDCTEVRCQTANPKNGRIEAYHLNPDWEMYRKENTTIVPAFSKANPTDFRESIMHGRDWTPGQTYYDHPTWWGTKAWTEVANKIAIFHKKGLENGYSIKYHIKVPAKYFEKSGDEAKMKLARTAFRDEITRFLNDKQVTEKTFISTFNVDQETGKVLPGIEIIPINNQMSDDAYTKLLEAANQAQSAGHNLPPQISNISFGGKFGASGSEIRSALQVHLAIHTAVGREILLEPFYAIKKIMGWDRNLFFEFEDKIVTTLDESKTGYKTSTNYAA